jgi:hypothetical protein
MNPCACKAQEVPASYNTPMHHVTHIYIVKSGQRFVCDRGYLVLTAVMSYCVGVLLLEE